MDNGTDPSSSQFDIEVRFLNSPTLEQRGAFETAAARWRGAITGDLSAVKLTASSGVDANSCGITHPAVRETVEDVLIFVVVRPLDGPGGLLGQAGPCIYRTPGFQTVVGVMEFDSVDLSALADRGTLVPVIIHEMGHVLGFGTTWSAFNPSKITGSGTTDPLFTGEQAKDYFGRAGATMTNGVPLENCVAGVPASCGDGTRDLHWRESTFRTEIMTGYVSPGSNPLSAVTIASFADLGYKVNLGAADTYRIPSVSAFDAGATDVMPIREKLIQPRFAVPR
ncbi:MAG: leishmanolysin-related zinc metalloendopeptidase [Longimicrobiales bacterium]